MDEKFWSTSDAARLSGLSVDMLNYLQRTGIVASRKVASQQRMRGKPRAYTFADLIILKAIGSLTAAGVSVLRLQKSIRAARRIKIEENERVFAGRYLVTSGDVARFVAEDELAQLLPTLGATLVLIDTDQLRDALLKALRSAS